MDPFNHLSKVFLNYYGDHSSKVNQIMSNYFLISQNFKFKLLHHNYSIAW